MKWEAIKELVSMPPDQRFMAAELLVIVTLCGIIGSDWSSKSRDAKTILSLTREIATNKAQWAAEKVQLIQAFDKKNQEVITATIVRIDKKERQLDSAIEINRQAMQINYKTLKKYAR